MTKQDAFLPPVFWVGFDDQEADVAGHLYLVAAEPKRLILSVEATDRIQDQVNKAIFIMVHSKKYLTWNFFIFFI